MKTETYRRERRLTAMIDTWACKLAIILASTSWEIGSYFSRFSLSTSRNVALRSNEVSVTDWRNISRSVPVICEKCSKRYPRNKFSRNFPSYTREITPPSSRENLFFSRCRTTDPFFYLPLAFACDSSGGWLKGPEREREREMRAKKASWKDDRAGPLAIISLATTRQMSDYCESRRLVGRFSSFSCSRCYGNNKDVGREHNNHSREKKREREGEKGERENVCPLEIN